MPSTTNVLRFTLSLKECQFCNVSILPYVDDTDGEVIQLCYACFQSKLQLLNPHTVNEVKSNNNDDDMEDIDNEVITVYQPLLSVNGEKNGNWFYQRAEGMLDVSLKNLPTSCAIANVDFESPFVKEFNGAYLMEMLNLTANINSETKLAIWSSDHANYNVHHAMIWLGSFDHYLTKLDLGYRVTGILLLEADTDSEASRQANRIVEMCRPDISLEGTGVQVSFFSSFAPNASSMLPELPRGTFMNGNNKSYLNRSFKPNFGATFKPNFGGTFKPMGSFMQFPKKSIEHDLDASFSLIPRGLTEEEKQAQDMEKAILDGFEQVDEERKQEEKEFDNEEEGSEYEPSSDDGAFSMKSYNINNKTKSKKKKKKKKNNKKKTYKNDNNPDKVYYPGRKGIRQPPNLVIMSAKWGDIDIRISLNCPIRTQLQHCE